MFSHIIGNDHIKTYLQRMLQKKAIGNSLLFAGPDGVGKSLYALAFAKALICDEGASVIQRRKVDDGTHPDIHIYHPEGKIGMHSIDSMRQLSEEVYLAPFESKWKVFIIHDAERMLAYSANALLKTFEEPSLDSVIILLSSAPEKLLPTIMSRCRTIHFHEVEEAKIANLLQNKAGKSAEEAAHLAALARGSVGQAMRSALDGGSQVRDAMLKLLAAGKVASYQQLTGAAKEISEHIEQAAQNVEDASRDDVMKGLPEGLSATQKHSIEKELEGLHSMNLATDALDLFTIILSWYRDMHLLHVGGDARYLIHRDYHHALVNALQYGYMLPLESVQQSIREAKLAFERSTPLNMCLENLFLRLNLI